MSISLIFRRLKPVAAGLFVPVRQPRRFWRALPLALIVAGVCVVPGAFWANPAEAQQREYYRWEDKDGQVNFGDSPPPDARNVQKFSPAAPPRKRVRADRARINEEQQKLAEELRKRDGAEETEDQIDTAKELLAKQKELDEARCSALRNNLKSLSAGARIFTTDPETGEKKFLEDAEIDKRRARTEATIAKECN